MKDIYFVVKCKPEQTLLEGELKNANSTIRKSWEATAIPAAFRTLPGIENVTEVFAVENGTVEISGQKVTLPLAAGVHA
jgi:hypothetical protein